MIYQLLEKLDSKHPFDQASAHCDIPCKVYDPMNAQLAVLTMIRMVDLLEEIRLKKPLSFEQQATFMRLVGEKENQGKLVKDEIRIIWGDYIKPAQIEDYPKIHNLTHEIMLASSYAKQHIDRKLTLELLDKVNQFAEVFWQTKGVPVYRATAPYPPSETLVYPDLKP